MCDLVAHRLTVIDRDASLFLAVNRDTQEAVRELFVIHELKSEPGNVLSMSSAICAVLVAIRPFLRKK